MWRHSLQFCHEWSCNHIPDLNFVWLCQKIWTKVILKNFSSDTQRQNCWQNCRNVRKISNQNGISIKGSRKQPPSPIFNVGRFLLAVTCSLMFQKSTLKLGGRGARGKIGRSGGTFPTYNFFFKIMLMWKFCQPILSLGVWETHFLEIVGLSFFLHPWPTIRFSKR